MMIGSLHLHIGIKIKPDPSPLPTSKSAAAQRDWTTGQSRSRDNYSDGKERVLYLRSCEKAVKKTFVKYFVDKTQNSPYKTFLIPPMVHDL